MLLTSNQFTYYWMKLRWGKYFLKQPIGFYPQVILFRLEGFLLTTVYQTIISIIDFSSSVLFELGSFFIINSFDSTSFFLQS